MKSSREDHGGPGSLATDMTIQDFRKDKAMVASAAAALANPIVKVMLGVLREEHPKNYRAADDHTGYNAPFKIGRIYGYDEFETNLLKLATVEAPQETIVATFAPHGTETA